MSFMFEVYYRPPTDPAREESLSRRVAALGGRLDFREEADNGKVGVCLTYEFDNYESAREAATVLREAGEHVEGPGAYGA